MKRNILKDTDVYFDSYIFSLKNSENFVMIPAGSLTDTAMLHLALSRIPGGRANLSEMGTYLMAHQNDIQWPNPDERELKSCLSSAIQVSK